MKCLQHQRLWQFFAEELVRWLANFVSQQTDTDLKNESYLTEKRARITYLWPFANRSCWYPLSYRRRDADSRPQPAAPPSPSSIPLRRARRSLRMRDGISSMRAIPNIFLFHAAPFPFLFRVRIRFLLQNRRKTRAERSQNVLVSFNVFLDYFFGFLSSC